MAATPPARASSATVVAEEVTNVNVSAKEDWQKERYRDLGPLHEQQFAKSSMKEFHQRMQLRFVECTICSEVDLHSEEDVGASASSKNVCERCRKLPPLKKFLYTATNDMDPGIFFFFFLLWDTCMHVTNTHTSINQSVNQSINQSINTFTHHTQ